MERVRILGIAPYEGLKRIMENVAATRDDVTLTVFLGDIADCLEIISRPENKHYDIIISRGGTASLIKSATSIPVIEVRITALDILRAIHLAEACANRYAIVAYKSLTDCAKLLCTLTERDLPIVTINENTDLESVLARLMNEGTELILADMISSVMAGRLGLNSILMASGRESIVEAFDESYNLFRTFEEINKQAMLYRSLLENAPYQTLLYENKRLCYASVRNEQSTFVEEYLTKRLPELSLYDEQVAEYTPNRLHISVCSRALPSDENVMRALYVQKETALTLYNDRSVIIYDQKSVPHDFRDDSFFHQLYIAPVQKLLSHYEGTATPVMLLGEPGVGKNYVASYLYRTGPYKNKPFYIVDCKLISDKRWNSLMESFDSPFHKSGVSIYIKNISCLNGSKTASLIAMVSQSRICRRNQMLFSIGPSQEAESNQLYSYICNDDKCLIVSLPPLRSRLEELPQLANYCLSKLNIELGKQLVGLEPEAVSMLQSYDWPRNFDQFCRVLREIAADTDERYVHADVVKRFIDREPFALKTQHGEPSFSVDLGKPLERLEIEIAAAVLAQEKGNRSRAAARLGISRTKLWRMLKTFEEKQPFADE